MEELKNREKKLSWHYDIEFSIYILKKVLRMKKKVKKNEIDGNN